MFNLVTLDPRRVESMRCTCHDEDVAVDPTTGRVWATHPGTWEAIGQGTKSVTWPTLAIDPLLRSSAS